MQFLMNAGYQPTSVDAAVIGRITDLFLNYRTLSKISQQIAIAGEQSAMRYKSLKLQQRRDDVLAMRQRRQLCQTRFNKGCNILAAAAAA